MTKNEAEVVFKKHVKPIWGDTRILSIEEKKDRYLFEFAQVDDDFPVDYPIISVKKLNGYIEELSFVNPKHRKIIYGK